MYVYILYIYIYIYISKIETQVCSYTQVATIYVLCININPSAFCNASFLPVGNSSEYLMDGRYNENDEANVILYIPYSAKL